MKAYTTRTDSKSYKWLVLTLAAFTFTFVVAIPQMSLPVMFDEISAELGLSLVQVGWLSCLVCFGGLHLKKKKLKTGRTII